MTAPPSFQPDNTHHDPLLRNPHQTFTGMARMLKDQAHHVQLATAAQHLGYDLPAQRLRQQLHDWRQQMHKLAADYQHMQGKFSGMLYSQQRVLQKLQDMYQTILSNIEMALQLESCKRNEDGQRVACKRRTKALLQDCSKATIKARDRISQHATVAQEVQQEQNDLAAILDNAASSMQQVSYTAHHQQQLAGQEVIEARARTYSATRNADAAAGLVGPIGGITLLLCLAAPPACVAGLAGTAIAATSAASAHNHLAASEAAMYRSTAVWGALQSVHAEAVRADLVTANIQDVVVSQAGWVQSIVSGLADMEQIMDGVIDVSLSMQQQERKVVLQQLHREVSRLLKAITDVHDLSSSKGLMVQMSF